MKFYNKKGKRNYKVQKMINELEAHFSKKVSENPAFESQIIPATNERELQTMYNKHIVQDVEFTESKTTEKNKTTESVMAKKKNTDIEDVDFEDNLTDSKGLNTFDDDDTDNRFVDPFNRENPIVRDYVMGKDSLGRERVSSEGAKTTFEEPTSFKEAFEIPTYDEDGMEEKKETARKPLPKAEKRERPEPLNPSFDEMNSGKKKRSSKKFAKYIVEAVCMLSQKGFVWFANKDINPSKLAEYELNGEIDLSLLVSLEDGQQVTIKEFFAGQCLAAEQLSAIDETAKADLTEALTEVMMEKGIAPTPTQELIMITLTIFGGQAVTLMALKSQTNSLLAQLRVVNEGGSPKEVYNEPVQPQQESPVAAAPEPIIEEAEIIRPNETNFDDLVSDAFNETELEEIVQTIE